MRAWQAGCCASLALALAVCATLALGAGAAIAEEPGIEVGGEVPSYLSLRLTMQGDVTSATDGACSLRISAHVTASAPGAQLSLVGDEGPYGVSLASWAQPIGDRAVSVRLPCSRSHQTPSPNLLYLTLSAQTP